MTGLQNNSTMTQSISINYYLHPLVQTINIRSSDCPDRHGFHGMEALYDINKMRDALLTHDYKRAAFEMLNSKWAEQVKGRAVDLAQGMLTGTYNI